LLVATLVSADDLSRLDGHVAATTLRPGELLRRSDLQPAAAPAAQRAMSLPVAPEHAVGGRLSAGDRVDVIEVRDGVAAYLVTDAEVLDVPDSDARGGLAGLRSFSVTLAVDAETALRLALAQHHGDLHLVRSTGAATADIERVGDAGTPPAEPTDEEDGP
jgi:Flp pilus assembly protein CpaB